MNTEKWYFSLTPREREIDWQTQGGRIIEYIRQAMPAPVTLTRWIAPTEGPPDDPLFSNGQCLYSDDLPGRLVFAYMVDGINVFIEADHQFESEADLEPWLSVFDQAYVHVFDDEPEHEWWVVIGQRRAQMAHVPKLIEGGVIGKVVVEAATTAYTEGLKPLDTESLSSLTVFSSFPLVIRGRSSGYNWNVAAQRAVIEANTVCALLSLAFDSYWFIRISPRVDAGGSIELPARDHSLSGLDNIGTVLGGVKDVRIPPWINRAREIIGTDETLFRALHAHRQGLSLMGEHPSLSLVCFVSTIEAIGSKFVELEECERCGQRLGAGRRFRKGLKTVFTNRQMKPLLDAYELRSQTAHSGVLHGNEGVMGGSPIFDYEPFAGLPPGLNFAYQTLRKMQEASRLVLLKQLSEGLDSCYE